MTMRSFLKAQPIRSGRDVAARAGFRALWMAIGGVIVTVAGFLLDLPPLKSREVAFVVVASVLVLLAGLLLDAYHLSSRHPPPP